MNKQIKPDLEPGADPIDALVADYLKTEAASVDGRALLERARASHRRRRRWHNVRLVLATAAMLVIGVGLGLLLLPEESLPEPPQRPNPTAWVPTGLPEGFPSPRDPVVAEFTASFKNDAAHLSGQLQASVASVLDSAGLSM